MPTKIIHTADTHLGATQYQISERVDDFSNSFLRVIGGALRRNVDALIHAGDLFEHEYPRNETVETAIDIINRLGPDTETPHVPVYLVHGDHDHPPGERMTPGVDRVVEETHAERLNTDPTIIDNNTVLYGVHDEDVEALVNGKLDFVSPPDGTHVLFCTHVLFRRYNCMGKPNDYTPYEVIQTIPFKIDALLCGEIHRRKHLIINETDVFYAGVLERVKPDLRNYNPSVYIHEISNEKIKTKTYSVPPRPWEQLKIEVSPTDDLDAVVNRVFEWLRPRRERQRMMLEVTLDGENKQFTQRDVRDRLEKWSGSLHVTVSATASNDDWLPGVPR